MFDELPATSGRLHFAGRRTLSGTALYVQPGNDDLRVGTYGQYSLGLAGQIVNTGWLGFVRVDYRNGEHIDGWTGNAGIRYQFTPRRCCRHADQGSQVADPGHRGNELDRLLRWRLLRRRWGPHRHRIPGLAPGDQQAVGIRTDRRHPAGLHYQFTNNWVLGIEGDIAPPMSTAAQRRHQLPSRHEVGVFGLQDKTSWMATATARVGYAMGRTLFYGKAGAASKTAGFRRPASPPRRAASWGPNLCANQAGAVFANGTGFGTSSTARPDHRYGAEFHLGNNWSAKAEYDYISFGRHMALASDGTTTIKTGPTSAR